MNKNIKLLIHSILETRTYNHEDRENNYIGILLRELNIDKKKRRFHIFSKLPDIKLNTLLRLITSWDKNKSPNDYKYAAWHLYQTIEKNRFKRFCFKIKIKLHL